MKIFRPILTALTLATAATTPVWGADSDYILYEPKPTTASRPPASPEEGLLVRSITIRPGDTLWALATKYRGKGSYYPQFLLVNKIENPNLIYAGKTLHVPVTPDQPKAAATPAPRAEKRHPHPAPVRQAEEKPAPAAVHHEPPRDIPRTFPAETRPQGQSNEEAEQRLFEAASREYKRGDCRKALESFDQFLNRYPSSILAADVSLYRADCYMKLSGQ